VNFAPVKNPLGAKSPQNLYTLCLKNVPTFHSLHISYTVRLQQFLAECYRETIGSQNVTYFIFPPHLTIASALPGETRKLHLNAACFDQKHET